MVSFGHLWPLWLLLALPLMWIAGWRHRSALSRRRMLLALALRSIALLLLTMALMRPGLTRNVHDVSVVYALDISRSVSPGFIQAALDWIAIADAQGKPAQARYLVFGDRAHMVDTLEAVKSVAVTEQASSSEEAVDQSATNLERALDLSLFGFAPEHAKRLVLLSDGNQTEGDVWRALPRLQGQGVRVFAVSAAVSVDKDAWIEACEAPEGVRQQEPAAVQVRLFSRTPASARVELSVADEAVLSQTIALAPGANELTFRTQFKQAGANLVAVRVIAEGDQVSENDRLSQTVWVGPKPKVLYVEGAPEGARYLGSALRKQGIDVSVADVTAFGNTAQRLGAHDVVILSDVAAERIGHAAAQRLEGFVREGGGLIFVAGENTYGKAGFAGGKIEALLPVKFEGQPKRKQLDLVLLIDRSFSMRGQKLEFAKSAALATLDLLEEQHRLAVVGFDAQAHDVVPLVEIGNKRRAEDLIAGMSASGQTNLYNALWHAHELLLASRAKTKHVILLSDGNTAAPGPLARETAASRQMDLVRKARGLPAEQAGPDTPGAQSFADVAALLAAEKVTLSTVAIGEKPDLELMRNLAAWTHGKSHVASNETEIPSLFVAEAKRLLGESIVEEPFRPTVKARTEALAGLDFSRAPPLKGFVISRPKRYAEVVLQAKDGQPLLAQTHYGLGRTVAFLSDLKNRWAADWLNWPGYSRLWAQVVRESMRRDSGEELALRVTRSGREAELTLTALSEEGAFRDALLPRVRVTDPAGGSFEVLLRQVGPGQYRARVPLRTSAQAPYEFRLMPTPGVDPDEIAKVGTRSLLYAYSDEYRVLPPDHHLLNALSERTGGKFAPKAEEVFANYGDATQVTQPLGPYCAAAALLLFLLDTLLRRLPRLTLARRMTVTAASEVSPSR